MELEKVNKLLANLDNISGNDLLSYVEKIEIRTPIPSSYGDGVQGEANEFAKVYRVKGEEDLFLKVTYLTDSYGYGEQISGVEFVKPTQKTVIDYVKI